MNATNPLSLREQFIIATRDLPGVEKRHQENIKAGQGGSAADAEQRLSGIAATLPDKLAAFIRDVGDGKTRITNPGEAYRHDEEPLRFEIALPSQLSDQESFALFDRLLRSKAYQDIAAVTGSPTVDMALRASFNTESTVGGGNAPRSVNSLVIEINPARPAQKKTPGAAAGGMSP